MLNWGTMGVFLAVFVVVAIVGLRAASWRSGDLSRLVEWGLAGKQVGFVAGWFLLAGTIYSANAFIAIPGLVYAQGAQGFYPVIYTTLDYILLFVVLTRFWIIARHRGYVTTADFVRERFGRGMAVLVALTGILATMPYLAVQLYGIEVVIAQMGIPVEAALLVAFFFLSISTYLSGLRAPAAIAFLKQSMLILVVLVGWIAILPQIGGLSQLFAAVHQKTLQQPATFSDILLPSQYLAFSTQILGAALALFLYPHTITVFLSVKSHKVLKRNAVALIFYSFLLFLVVSFGYLAIAARIQPSATYKTNAILPALFMHFFPAWFTGFAFAALVLGALVPAAIMSIGVANLFTRNIYREYLRPACSEREETRVARAVSLLSKCGALVIILFIPITFANNLQLMGSVWILQTLPAVFLGLYTRWFQRGALMLGWIGGMIAGTWMLVQQNFASFSAFQFGAQPFRVYTGIVALGVNLALAVALTPMLRRWGKPDGPDLPSEIDFQVEPLLHSASSSGAKLPEGGQDGSDMGSILPGEVARKR